MGNKTCPIQSFASESGVPVINPNKIMAMPVGDDPHIVRVNMMGVIGEYWDMNTTAEELMMWNGITEDTAEIHVYIASHGGDMLTGIAMYHMLKNHPAKVFTYNLSHVSSAATLPFLAGDVRVMPEGTMSLIHNPWSCGCFNGNEAAAFKATMDQYSAQLRELYVTAMNVSDEKATALMDGEADQDGTMIHHSEALELGYSTTDSYTESTITESSATQTQARAFALSINQYNGEKIMAGKKTEGKSSDTELTLPQATSRISILETEAKELNSKIEALSKELAAEKEATTKASADAEALRESLREEIRADEAELTKVKNIAEGMGLELKATTADAGKREVLAHKGVDDAEDETIHPKSSIDSTFNWFVKRDSENGGDFDDVVNTAVNNSDKDDDSDDSDDAFAGMEAV